MTKICVPIVEETTEAVIQKIKCVKKSSLDIIEVWLGHIENPDIPKIISSSTLPVLVNCKGEDEQGNFEGTENEKVNLLISAAQAGAAYIDISGESDEKIIQKIAEEKGKAKLILSLHYFRGTPGLPHLTTALAKLMKFSPDIVKFAALPRNLKDVVTMIRLAEKLCSKNIPHIVISMGKLGKVTRIASPVLENEIMFATLTDAEITAPGQTSVKKLKDFFGELR